MDWDENQDVTGWLRTLTQVFECSGMEVVWKNYVLSGDWFYQKHNVFDIKLESSNRLENLLFDFICWFNISEFYNRFSSNGVLYCTIMQLIFNQLDLISH